MPTLSAPTVTSSRIFYGSDSIDDVNFSSSLTNQDAINTGAAIDPNTGAYIPHVPLYRVYLMVRVTFTQTTPNAYYHIVQTGVTGGTDVLIPPQGGTSPATVLLRLTTPPGYTLGSSVGISIQAQQAGYTSSSIVTVSGAPQTPVTTFTGLAVTGETGSVNSSAGFDAFTEEPLSVIDTLQLGWTGDQDAIGTYDVEVTDADTGNLLYSGKSSTNQASNAPFLSTLTSAQAVVQRYTSGVWPNCDISLTLASSLLQRPNSFS